MKHPALVALGCLGALALGAVPFVLASAEERERAPEYCEYNPCEPCPEGETCEPVAWLCCPVFTAPPCPVIEDPTECEDVLWHCEFGLQLPDGTGVCHDPPAG